MRNSTADAIPLSRNYGTTTPAVDQHGEHHPPPPPPPPPPTKEGSCCHCCKKSKCSSLLHSLDMAGFLARPFFSSQLNKKEIWKVLKQQLRDMPNIN